MAPTSTGTFEPLRHRSGTMRERLHAYTKRTLGAGGSYNDAVRKLSFSTLQDFNNFSEWMRNRISFVFAAVYFIVFIGGTAARRILCGMGCSSCDRLLQWREYDMGRYVLWPLSELFPARRRFSLWSGVSMVGRGIWRGNVSIRTCLYRKSFGLDRGPNQRRN